MVRYILVGKLPIQVFDLIEWSQWMETADRRVARDKIGDIVITTMFLGLDRNISRTSSPILFETIILGGNFDKHREQYHNWEEAEAGHQHWVEKVRNAVSYAEVAYSFETLST